MIPEASIHPRHRGRGGSGVPGEVRVPTVKCAQCATHSAYNGNSTTSAVTRRPPLCLLPSSRGALHTATRMASCFADPALPFRHLDDVLILELRLLRSPLEVKRVTVEEQVQLGRSQAVSLRHGAESLNEAKVAEGAISIGMLSFDLAVRSMTFIVASAFSSAHTAIGGPLWAAPAQAHAACARGRETHQRPLACPPRRRQRRLRHDIAGYGPHRG